MTTKLHKVTISLHNIPELLPILTTGLIKILSHSPFPPPNLLAIQAKFSIERPGAQPSNDDLFANLAYSQCSPYIEALPDHR